MEEFRGDSNSAWRAASLEIWMLDSANYNAGTVTIGKSVSILMRGNLTFVGVKTPLAAQ